MFKLLLKKFSKSDSDKKEVIAGSAVSFLVKGFGFLFSFISVFIITNQYGTATQGYFALGLTVVQFGGIIAKLGVDSAIIKFVAENKGRGQLSNIGTYQTAGLLLILFSGIIVTLIVYFTASIIAEEVFNKPDLEYYILIGSCVIVPYSLMEYYGQSLRGLKKIALYSFLLNVSKHLFLTLLILILLFVFGLKPNVMWLFLFGILISMIIGAVFWYKQPEVKKLEFPKRIQYNKLFKYALPLALVSSFSFLTSWIDQLMLGVFNSAEEVGVYNVSYRLSFLLTIVLMSTNSIIKPKIAEFYGANEMGKLNSVVRYYSKMVFFLTLPIFLIIVLSSFVIYPNLFSDINTVLLNDSYWVLLFLCFGQYFNAICGSTGAILTMTGRQKIYLGIITVMILLKVGLNFYLIPTFGIIGASVAGMVSLVITNISAVYFIHRDFKILTIYNPFHRKRNE